MLEWIDHDTFRKKNFATFYNYSNFVRIALVDSISSKIKLIGVDNNSKEWVFGEISNDDTVSLETLKEEFIEFMNNRPPIIPTVPDIKPSKIQI